jgi:50S ribosomal subunit-associated GTPase HflX
LELDAAPRIAVFNKVDAVPQHASPDGAALAVSAYTGQGLDQLRSTVAERTATPA